MPIIGGVQITGDGLTTVTIGVRPGETGLTENMFTDVPAPDKYTFDPIHVIDITIYFNAPVQTNVSIDLYGCVNRKYSPQMWS